MQVHRFDPEISIPVTDFGSQFRIGPLTGDDTRARVQILHLDPGGCIGRHPTQLRQLLAVVAGSGWAEGGDGVRRHLPAGYAAVWEPGEDHEAGTEDGFTAVSLEGSFEMWALRVTRDIVVADPDPAWPDWFETVRAFVWPAVADLALRIDHVGSTSVPGLAAKPIIDMDIVVADESALRPVIGALAGLGYRWRGEMGVPGRHAFFLTDPERLPGPLPEHHLYLVVENNKAHLDHWLLRDLLRSDAEARRRYGELKRANAEAAQGDLDHYVAAKAALVAELLTRARHQRGLPPAEYWVP